MPLETSYTTSQSQSSGGVGGSAQIEKQGDYWPLSKLKKAYTNYLNNKADEINEQIDARRYYHGSQYTLDQIRVLKRRKQPQMTFNRIARKIDATVGLIERLRQDPKAWPRTPQHAEGADLATAALRYVLDENQWKYVSPIVAGDGAVDGIGGIELTIEQGDQGDPEIGFDFVDIQSFFYDPKSWRDDFSDARYMGVGKWLDDDIAQEMYPDASANAFVSGTDLQGSTDREMRWFVSDGVAKRVRVVECWYQHKGGWCWAQFTGSAILKEGKSYFKDEKGKGFCKYQMFSGQVDQDGDRYGFIRNMKSAQDGINAKQSKMQHMIASKRLVLSQGAVDDVEKARAEWARPDGVIITNRPVNEGVKVDDQSFDFAGLAKLLELNLAEIENFGPNPALIGQGIENKSGRAIGMLQQAGIAELGPYIQGFRAWKIRVYRAIWSAIQQHWQAERWIRVTDSEGLGQFIQINGMGIDPQTGMPTIVNAVGQLDVDIIMDEAPDAVTLAQQSFETLQAMGPQFAMQFPLIAIELMPIDSATKKLVKDQMQQSSQAKQPMDQLAMAMQQAKTHQTEADAQLKEAQTQKTLVEAHVTPMQALMEGQGQPVQPGKYQLPPEIQHAQAMAEIGDKQASAAHKQAQAYKAQQEADLAPHRMHMDHMNMQADRMEAARQADEDRKIAAQQSGSLAQR